MIRPARCAATRNSSPGRGTSAVHEEFALAVRDLDTWSRPEVRSEIAQRVLSPGKDSFTVRKLMSPLVLADEAQRAHLLRSGTAGTQVRISSAPLPHETIILDRRVAILAGQPSPRWGSRGRAGHTRSTCRAGWDPAPARRGMKPRAHGAPAAAESVQIS